MRVKLCEHCRHQTNERNLHLHHNASPDIFNQLDNDPGCNINFINSCKNTYHGIQVRCRTVNFLVKITYSMTGLIKFKYSLFCACINKYMLFPPKNILIKLWRNLIFICHRMYTSNHVRLRFVLFRSCEMSTGPLLVLWSYNTLRSDDWSFKGKEDHDAFVGAKQEHRKEECASY